MPKQFATLFEVYSDQADFDLRCEWGLAGLRAVQTSIDAVVVVDVLSFSTAVDEAVKESAREKIGRRNRLPHLWKHST